MHNPVNIGRRRTSARLFGVARRARGRSRETTRCDHAAGRELARAPPVEVAWDAAHIAGERGRGVGLQEPAPRTLVAPGRGRDTTAAQQALDRGAGTLDPEPAQLTANALVAPRRILAGQPRDQGPWSRTRAAAAHRKRTSRHSGLSLCPRAEGAASVPSRSSSGRLASAPCAALDDNVPGGAITARRVSDL